MFCSLAECRVVLSYLKWTVQCHLFRSFKVLFDGGLRTAESCTVEASFKHNPPPLNHHTLFYIHFLFILNSKSNQETHKLQAFTVSHICIYRLTFSHSVTLQLETLIFSLECTFMSPNKYIESKSVHFNHSKCRWGDQLSIRLNVRKIWRICRKKGGLFEKPQVCNVLRRK